MFKLIVPNFKQLSILTISGLTLTSLVKLNLENESESLKIEQNVDPIPKSISMNGNKFDLIGYGSRNVSFLKFKVYLLGIYIANEDKPLLKKVFNSKYLESFYDDDECKNDESNQHKLNLEKALREPISSDLLWGNAINSGVKFNARICALRNTDMGHLRDGFIRTITNSPVFKSMSEDSSDSKLKERLDFGLNELRNVFNSYKVNAKKNSNIFMELNSQGGINVKIELFNGKKHENLKEIGIIKEPLIGQVLFTSYIGSNKPLVEKVNETCLSTILSLF